MPIKLGLVGLPNVGKSTLFNAMTTGQSAIGNFPFTTRERHVGAAPVRDDRLDAVAKVLRSGRVTPAHIELVDIAGLVRGASQGEGLGNQFLGHIREVDLILHVVRCFDDATVAVSGDALDPVTALEIVDTELILADLQTLERCRERLSPAARSGDRKAARALASIESVAGTLADGHPARSVPVETDPQLLTAKPVLIIANTGSGGGVPDLLATYAAQQGYSIIAVDAKLVHEFSQLPPQDRAELAQVLEDAGTDAILAAALSSLGLITFFTANATEARAWMVATGTVAPDAAGEVHSDMARGFIACEVLNWQVLHRAGSWQAARDQGVLRTEGARYQVVDGDVILFRFNV